MTDPHEYAFPLAEHLGMVMEMPVEGRAGARVELDERHMNPNGVVHGAVVFAMADTAMGAAVLSVLEPGRRCASTDVHIRYLRSVREGTVEVAVRVAHQGRRMITLEGEATADGRVVATVTGAFAVLDP